MQQHHVGMLGVDLVEPVPDRAMIVEVEAASKGDLRPRGKQYLRLGPSLGGQKLPAVDHRRSERAMVDQ